MLIGIAVCLLLNSVLLGLMMRLIPPPPGFDPKELSSFSLLETEHLLSPFVAHAVPSFIGGFLAALIAATRRLTMALVVGGLHMIGGILAAVMIPAPLWFIVADLTLAYLPMAWAGGLLALAMKRR